MYINLFYNVLFLQFYVFLISSLKLNYNFEEIVKMAEETEKLEDKVLKEIEDEVNKL